VTLRATPEATARAVAVVATYDSLEAREVAYEVPAAVVVGRQTVWHRVRLADGRSGWVAPDEGGRWFPYADLPVRRLAYLTGAWSGHVWPGPGAGIPPRSSRKDPTGREEYPVDVLESTLIGGSVWFRVSLLRDDPCDGGTDAVDLSGWVPGYGVTGAPTVWYFSRGC
jgi:hypothetical protein